MKKEERIIKELYDNGIKGIKVFTDDEKIEIETLFLFKYDNGKNYGLFCKRCQFGNNIDTLGKFAYLLRPENKFKKFIRIMLFNITHIFNKS